MRVIHIYKPFFEFGRKDHAGAMPKLWYAALIIIHELARQGDRRPWRAAMTMTGSNSESICRRRKRS